MESRRTKSQSNLLLRGGSSTELLPHTQSLYSKHSLYNAGTAVAPSYLPAIPSRPGSSRPPSRVDSRPLSSRPMSSRPVSRLDHSRPGSRMDSSRPSSRMMNRPPSANPVHGQRPCSAIRPLSGRVFMRRMEHGWVAKHYPDSGSNSHTNMDTELEDLSDCDSLDSFFEEEFDDRDHNEKLNNLLSCNTIAGDSKGQKKDWNTGVVDLSKFHCPRCRDHWYGITPFPCDEEIARLIREGLWHTGKGDPSKTYQEAKSGMQSGLPGTNGGGGSPSNGLGDSRGRRGHGIIKDKNGGRDSWEMGIDENKRNKRRITFKLDDKDNNGDERSGTIENGDSGLQSRQNTSNLDTALGNHHGGASGNNADGHFNKDDINADNAGLLKGLGSNDWGQKSGTSGGRTDGELSSLRTTSHEEAAGKRRNRGSSTQLTDEVGMGLANALAGSRGDNDTSGDKNMLGDGHISEGKNGHSDLNGSDKGDLGLGEGLFGSNSRRGSESSVTSSTLSKTGPDHGKKVRKAGGYMRTISPTGSEWGDPSHARPYASSTTASSHIGSTSNLLNDHDNKGKCALPPIIPPIKPPKKPISDFSEGRFEITPPWRFSYFSPSPLHSTRPATIAPAKKTRKKK